MGLPLHFFFYGTLIAGSRNPAAQAVHDLLRPIGPARISGALWAVPDEAGWYPALVTGGERVHGVLYAAAERFGPDDLARLDAWEDFRPDNLAASLFLREEVQLAGAVNACGAAQVYRYNQPVPLGAQPIPGGDFQVWLQATGFTAYAG